MRFVSPALAAVAYTAMLFGQDKTGDTDTMIFHFSRAGAEVPRYSVQVQRNDLAMYWVGPPDLTLFEAVDPHKLEIHETTRDKIFAARDTVITENCETKLKNIAHTGSKTLLYGYEHGSKSCTFNYSDDKRVNLAVETLEAVAQTLQMGERLAKLHRYDRLGLDAEMDSFVNEVKEGRALEVQNIAPVLQSIASDDRVIERVRRSAARLLQDAATTSK